MEFISYKNINLHYKRYGDPERPPVLLIHGYLETLRIWEGFAERLADDFHVITLDLPGHGKSGVLSSVHRMDDLAEAAHFLVSSLEYKAVHVAGHSLGGYVSLAYREIFHAETLSCILIHSSCYPDTQDKKNNRKREIKLLQEGKKELIIKTNIPRGFANQNLDQMTAAIEWAKEVAMENEETGISAILRGMMDRPDRCILLRDEKVPLLLIAGMRDNYIPMETYKAIAGMGSNVELSILENSGHMSFVEEPEKAAGFIKAFLKRIIEG